jgi:phage shock protein A/uncharacterized coiled-coil protein SlyX
MASLLRGTLKAKNIFGSGRKKSENNLDKINTNMSSDQDDSIPPLSASSADHSGIASPVSPSSSSNKDVNDTSLTATPKSGGGMFSRVFSSRGKSKGENKQPQQPLEPTGTNGNDASNPESSSSSSSAAAPATRPLVSFDTTIKEITDAKTIQKLDYQGSHSPDKNTSGSAPGSGSGSNSPNSHPDNKNNNTGKKANAQVQQVNNQQNQQFVIDDLTTQLKQEQQLCDEYKQQLDESNVYIDEIEAKLKQYKKDRKEILASFKQTEAELDRVNNEHKVKLEEMAALKGEFDVSADYIERIRVTLESFGYEEQSYEGGFPELIHQLLTKMAAQTQLQSQVEELAVHNDTLTAELEASKEHIAELESEIALSHTEKSSIMEKMLLHTDDNDNSSPEKSGNSNSSGNNNNNSNNSKGGSSGSDSNATIADLREKVANLELSLQARDITLAAATEKEVVFSDQLKQQSLKHEVAVNELRLHISKAEAVVNSVNLEKEKLLTTVKDLEQSLAGQNSTIQELGSQLVSMRTELQEAQDALALRADQSHKYSNDTTNWQTEKIDELNRMVVFLQQQQHQHTLVTQQMHEDFAYKQVTLRSEINALKESNDVLTKTIEKLEEENVELTQLSIMHASSESKLLCNAEIFRGNINAKDEELKVLMELVEQLTKELAAHKAASASGAINNNVTLSNTNNNNNTAVSTSKGANRAGAPVAASGKPRKSTSPTRSNLFNFNNITGSRSTHHVNDGVNKAIDENNELTRKLLRGAMVSMLNRSKQDVEASSNGSNSGSDEYIAEYRSALTVSPGQSQQPSSNSNSVSNARPQSAFTNSSPHQQWSPYTESTNSGSNSNVSPGTANGGHKRRTMLLNVIS